jgi:predicted dehydrogenase
MDLAQYLISTPIDAVCGDLATFHPRRYGPTGPSDTFSGSNKPGGPPSVREVEVTSDDHAAVLLKFAGGVRGAFHVSQVTAGRKNRLTIDIAASEGSISWDSESPNRLWIGARKGPNQLLERDPALLGESAAALCHYPGGHSEGFPDTFKQLFFDVYGWISAGAERQDRPSPAFPTFADGDREVRLCEAIAQSAATGTWARVQESSERTAK